MPTVFASRHAEAEALERGRGESRMQAERNVSGQLCLLVSKLKSHARARGIDLVSEIDRYFQRIIYRREIIRRDAITQRPAALGSLNRMPDFGSEKAVRATFDRVAAIKALSIFEAMEIITHHGGVICPTFSRSSDIVVAVKESHPFARLISSGQTDQLSA